MKGTKKRIADCALLLFNERGYGQVTIRMIAQKLKMSSGNLNYHFQKKSDILNALYFEMVTSFDKRIEHLTDQEISLKQIKADIRFSMERMKDYQFFWTDMYNIIGSSAELKTHFQNVYIKRLESSLYLFSILQDQKLMTSTSFELERKFLAERMINFGNTWLYNAQIYSIELDVAHIDNQANILFGMFYPYLTEKGKVEFKKVLPTLFK